jgi:hypothetical protein
MRADERNQWKKNEAEQLKRVLGSRSKSGLGLRLGDFEAGDQVEWKITRCNLGNFKSHVDRPQTPFSCLSPIHLSYQYRLSVSGEY